MLYRRVQPLINLTQELCNITREHLQSRQVKKDLNRNIYVIQESPTFDKFSQIIHIRQVITIGHWNVTL